MNIESGDIIEKYRKCISTNNNNSYKYVLGLSIIQINPKNKIIKFNDIADKVVDIYFNNIFINKLIEHNKNQETRVQIDMKNYFDKYGLKKELDKSNKEEIVKIIVNNRNNGFFKYVLPCFTGAKKGNNGNYIYPDVGCNEFFSYDINKQEIHLSENMMDIINKQYNLIKNITVEEYSKYLKKKNNNKNNIDYILDEY